MGDKMLKLPHLPPDTGSTLKGGNPNFEGDKILLGRHHFNLIMNNNGSVSASQDFKDPKGKMEFISVDYGQLKIRGVEADLYLAFKEDGQLYGEKNPSEEATIFIEKLCEGYKTYLSKKYKWYIGIKKTGIPKNGQLARPRQNAIKFSTVRCDDL